MYEWALRPLGRLGWIAAFVYCAGAALRLARFNTNIGVVDKRFFQGLPSPAAAALVAGFIWMIVDFGVGPDELIRWLAFGVTLFAGLSMVTTAPFYSGKDINLKRSVPFASVLVMLFAIVLVSFDPPTVLFGVFVVYGLSGYAMWLVRRRRPRSPAGATRAP
jgi:CDP-diacylglycerol--serine O-phosphatidyltransferase